MESLTSAGKDFNLRVSSTLNRDAKQFGKRNMFDDNCDTCWNSDHGSPQFVALEFPKPVSCFPMETETYHTSYKILFLSSTDLYGRITIYQMEMIGMISK
ncbi:PREDICTED: nuclear receptor 2C2-associated protein-like isoform X2 [Amphimedon queenslandica]|uniref:Nuclear receptor 2C2-associated protein n=1 Tax=Amphimedon queenslandica TaxID=400682 RepID=A0AAN0J6F5_AMPQE|nr:PREDICTED: nuclear receptor 2C2-associated protein-like isoform X2 [Amphimedon queenslandica]|eukprot:XP_019852301.1 PREDICTED: nuclear receptor 2C2-associated protein-like isoform X2 [Amphimedon queenslandica]